FIRINKEVHYLTEQHQSAIIKFVDQILSQTNVKHIDNDLPSVTTAANSNPDTLQSQELSEILNVLSEGTQVLKIDQQRLNNQSLQFKSVLQTLIEELSTLNLSTEESYAYFQAVKCNEDILNQELKSLQLRINDLQSISYDGIFVWKIMNVKEKMIDAQSERQTSIYSPPFYSSPNGYKMRARLYLNGDGNARRTHMSLFFVLMRSLNDSILKFPFNYKVTFCMYDQTSAKRHIIDSFRPDIRSNSFQRPQLDMNIASGIPKFFPLELIQQDGNPYVQNDMMFIKIMVDFEDIPKTLLPYIMNLNPGLPTHIQQAMMKKEAERLWQE
ncbi:unnamed protein product, partial [Rotaria sp. Silwood2]